jgi:hypothetical protein
MVRFSESIPRDENAGVKNCNTNLRYMIRAFGFNNQISELVIDGYKAQ